MVTIERSLQEGTPLEKLSWGNIGASSPRFFCHLYTSHWRVFKA